MKNQLITRYIVCALTVIFVSFSVNAQKNKKPFYGLLVYKITSADTSMTELYPTTNMAVYTNDTIVRIENTTNSLGTQVTIRHMGLNKSYQLIDSEIGKYAIQDDLSNYDTVTKKDRYTFEKSKLKKKILGKKSKSVLVTSEQYKTPKTFYYLDEYSNKYVNTFPSVDGLLTEYYVVTYDVILKYELIRMSPYLPNIDLFGVPSDYERISIDDFMDKLLESKTPKGQ